VLYGKQSTQIGTSTTINGGKVGSLQLVTSVGNTNITADIHSDNLVRLANSNTIRGNITAANRNNSAGPVFSAGSNFSFAGNNAQIMPAVMSLSRAAL
jgi:hypothetical protein